MKIKNIWKHHLDRDDGMHHPTLELFSTKNSCFLPPLVIFPPKTMVGSDCGTGVSHQFQEKRSGDERIQGTSRKKLPRNLTPIRRRKTSSKSPCLRFLHVSFQGVMVISNLSTYVHIGNESICRTNALASR